MLGYRNLMKWVLLLMFSLRGEDFTSDPLFEEASIRGFFMEKLAVKVFRDDDIAGEAFITGVLSLVDVLLGVPKEEVIESMILEENIRRALLEGEGPLGDLLKLVEATQKGTLDRVKPLMERYELKPADLYSLQTEAIVSYSELDL